MNAVELGEEIRRVLERSGVQPLSLDGLQCRPTRRRRRTPPPPRGFVYFAQAGEGGPIKIGWALDVARRLGHVQVGCPYELRLLLSVAGGKATEGKLHRQFATLHMRGEWFRPEPKLLAFIAAGARP